MHVLLSLWFICLTRVVLDHVYIATPTYNCYLFVFYMHEKEEITSMEIYFDSTFTAYALGHGLINLLQLLDQEFKTFMYMFSPVGPSWTYKLVLITLLCILFVLPCLLVCLACLWPWLFKYPVKMTMCMFPLIPESQICLLSISIVFYVHLFFYFFLL